MRIEVFSGVDATNSKILTELGKQSRAVFSSKEPTCFYTVTGQWPIISDLYSSCMVSPGDLTASALQGLQTFVKPIGDLASLSSDSLFPLLADLHKVGIDAFFVPDVLNNIYVDGGDNYLVLWMSGISLSPASYNDGNATQKLASKINNVLSLVYKDATYARADNVVALEGRLANITIEPEEWQDFLDVTTVQQLNAITSMDYFTYVNNLLPTVNASLDDPIMVSVDAFFANLAPVLNNTELQTVQDYLMWRSYVSLVFPTDSTLNMTLRSRKVCHQNICLFIAQLPLKIRDMLHAEFIDGDSFASRFTVEKQQAYCTDAVDSLLGDYIGLLFSTKYARMFFFV